MTRRPQLTRAALLLGIGLATARAHAEDPLGVYVGGALGQSRVATDGGSLTSEQFKENHSAYKVMLGLRPIPLLGAEVEYVDFGRPGGTAGPYTMKVALKGAAACGMVYLPVPVVDVYGKLGLARLQNSTSPIAYTGPVPPGGGTCVRNVTCDLAAFSRTDTSAAYGIGAQYRLGSLAVRGEFERYTVSGGNPMLWSLGLTWGF